MFQKKYRCKLCGVKTTETERCPKCGYSFRRTISDIDRCMNEVKYGVRNKVTLDIGPLLWTNPPGNMSVPEIREVFGLKSN